MALSIHTNYSSLITQTNLGKTNNALGNMKDNTDMAKGRIMDADFAKESANMTKNSMLLPASLRPLAAVLKAFSAVSRLVRALSCALYAAWLRLALANWP